MASLLKSVDENLNPEKLQEILTLGKATAAAASQLSDEELNALKAQQDQVGALETDLGIKVSEKDKSLLVLNARKFAPQVVNNTAGSVAQKQVDTSTTASLSESSDAYIAPLEGDYTLNGEKYFFSSATKNPYLFTVDINKEDAAFADQTSYNANRYSVADEIAERDGYQYRYVLNYTTGTLTENNGEFTYTAPTNIDSDLVGFSTDEYTTYVKFVSQSDLEGYGAIDTGEVDEEGQKIYTWGDNINTFDGNPLTLLDGETVITKAGWYDFTRVEDNGDGAKFITNTFDDGTTRIVGVEIIFTDNLFGDKSAKYGLIVDPGSPVAETTSQAVIDAGLLALTKVFLDEVPPPTPEVQEVSSARDVIEDPIKFTGVGPGQDARGISDKFGIDDAGAGEGSAFAAMIAGDAPGQGSGAGASNSSGSGEGDLNQQINNFLQGEGEAEGQGAGRTQGAGGVAQQGGGQGLDGQGQGIGGEAALGEDQTPATQRKRGLMLQPLMQQDVDQEDTKTSSTLLKNLSEGSLMGNNLLDALALGAGVLYALYAPKAVDTGRKGWKQLLNRFRKQANGGSVPIAEKNVLSVFAMKMPNGGERLMAAKVGMGGIEVIAQQDLPADARVGQPGSDTQIDFGVSQLLAKLEGKRFDLALIGPKLRNQSPLVQAIAKESQLLDTQSLVDRLSTCSSADIAALQEWLNKPSTTPPESSPVFDLLNERVQRYGSDLAQEQASMSSLIELSVAMGWSQYGETA